MELLFKEIVGDTDVVTFFIVALLFVISEISRDISIILALSLSQGNIYLIALEKNSY